MFREMLVGDTRNVVGNAVLEVVTRCRHITFRRGYLFNGLVFLLLKPNLFGGPLLLAFQLPLAVLVPSYQVAFGVRHQEYIHLFDLCPPGLQRFDTHFHVGIVNGGHDALMKDKRADVHIFLEPTIEDCERLAGIMITE